MVAEDDASVCNLSCLVKNFVFARNYVNGNRHDLTYQFSKYTYSLMTIISTTQNLMLLTKNT